jgi:hypothetical protein
VLVSPYKVLERLCFCVGAKKQRPALNTPEPMVGLRLGKV